MATETDAAKAPAKSPAKKSSRVRQPKARKGKGKKAAPPAVLPVPSQPVSKAGPLVGDSAYQSAQEDSLSQHRPASDSDGTSAGTPAPESTTRVNTGKIQKAEICDDIVYVIDGRNAGKLRPGKVLRRTNPDAEGAENSPIDLVAWTDSGKFPNNDHLPATITREGVRYSEGLEVGTWHWPEDSERLLEKAAKAAADA